MREEEEPDMAVMELQLVQCKADIENPVVTLESTRVSPNLGDATPCGLSQTVQQLGI